MYGFLKLEQKTCIHKTCFEDCEYIDTIFLFVMSFSSFGKVHTAWKVFKYGVFSGPYFPIFGLSTEI